LKEKFKIVNSPSEEIQISNFFSRTAIQQHQQQSVLSPTSPSNSPFTPGSSHLEVNSNTLIDLISLLNHIYQDHDFRFVFLSSNKDIVETETLQEQKRMNTPSTPLPLLLETL
jgi:hypothetical protein